MFLRNLLSRLAVLTALCAAVLPLGGCNQVDLKSAVEVTELTSGYYDAGVTELGSNKLVPNLTFRLKNISSEPIRSIELIVYFWGVEYEEPKEMDEVLITGIGSTDLAPQASTEPIVVRSKQGFALQEQARSELFNHRLFRDMTAKLFLKRGGRVVPFGEFTIDRRLLLAAPAGITVQ